MTAWKKWTKWLTGWACAVLAALVLALALPPVNAASYMQPYLDKVVDWGVMQGDLSGNLNEDGNISRAEFVAMVNRAFGYTKTGPTPFQDIETTDWYAEDVGIAYNIGYITGTSANRFSPNASVTREQAAVIMARIMMLPAQTGENTMFTDGRDMSSWSRGLIEAAALYGLINGYPDGTFSPQANLSRGQAAILLVNALGTPLLEADTYTLGDVWGNVTITQSDTVLRNTVIGGNLYISAGVDLGDVLLENVTVLGEIVICGGGVSESGDDSIILRNVDAGRLVVDNMTNQLVSLRVEGYGTIADATIRTNAYVVDQTGSDYGLNKINFAGEEGLSLTLSGNVKTVLNTTPGSTVNLAKGQAQVITMDEYAVDSILNISPGAVAGTVNLDTATEVTGSGDIDKIYVNADGSTVTMLPDQIEIRPGNTAEINGEVMDNQAAAEASSDPRLNAGYPRVKDLAPTSATIEFMGNKKGTVYWAVTAVTDGSLSADQLINPSSYSPKVVLNGTSSLTGANQAVTAALSKLTSDGSYYLSAVMVDAREQRSPLKVISFTTPDDTKPDFADGYPYLSKITHNAAQVTVMANKTCRLYYAVLLKGSTPPTGDDFKANAVTGNLGFGTMDVEKNNSYTLQVNNVPLAELEDYELHLWLTDIDGAQSSDVETLSFTTVDGTPPVFNTEPTINKVDKTSVGLYANLNEDGTLYWVVVAQGEEYPKPLAGQTNKVSLSSLEAKVQVMNGMNAFKSGKVTMTENKDTTFTVSGLEAEKAYDLYYVAQDKAGNYSATVGKITIHTADSTPPTVTQEFSSYSGTDTVSPYADTDVTLVFSEAIADDETNQDIEALYNQIFTADDDEKEPLKEELGKILSNNIILYYHSGNGRPEEVTSDETADHWIDYTEAVVKFDDKTGTLRITFQNGVGISLMSGATYNFEVSGFADMSNEKNVMTTAQLPQFTTLFAQISITEGKDAPVAISKDQVTADDATLSALFPAGTDSLPIDFYWQLEPMAASQVDDSIKWDMMLWSDTLIEFELFRREPGATSWTYLGSGKVPVTSNTPWLGISLQMDIIDPNNNNPIFPQLNSLDDEKIYEYAIHTTSVQDSPDRNAWSKNVTIRINTVAGRNNPLGVLGNSITEETWNNLVGAGKDVLNIGIPESVSITHPFRDQAAPYFTSGYPTITAGDSTVQMDVMLSRPGTVFWMVAERNLVNTINSDGVTDYGKADETTGKPYVDLPRSGKEDGLDNNNGEPITEANHNFIKLQTPTDSMITDPARWVTNEEIQYGFITAGSASTPIKVDGLDANKDYIVYFVIQGTSNVFSDVLCYRFTTGDVTPAYITLDTLNNPKVGMKVSQDAGELYYALYAPSNLPLLPSGSIDKTLLKDHLSSTLTEDQKDEFNKITNSDKMTLLTAMLTTYKSDGESIFDHFASADIKKEVYEALSAQGGAGSLSGGMLSNVPMNQRETVDFEAAMDPNSITPYICIAAAQNELGGEWSFKAINGVRIPDGVAPYLIQVISPNATKRPDGLYQGSLTLKFNETLYYTDGVYDDAGVALKNIWSVVHQDVSIGSHEDVVGFKNICSITGQYAQISYKNTSLNATDTFELSFVGFAVGDSITIPINGALTDLDENTNTTHSYTLQLQQVKGENIGVIENPDGVAYQFVLISGTLGP